MSEIPPLVLRIWIFRKPHWVPLRRMSPDIITIITKTCLYNFDPLKPHLYIVKLGFTGVYIIFLNLLKYIYCVYPLEPSRRGGSKEYPQSMFWEGIWKKHQIFFIWKFSFLVLKFSICLNKRVFVKYLTVSNFSPLVPRIWIFRKIHWAPLWKP